MMKKTKVAYCTGFWCTNIGNAFFSMGVEYALKKVLGVNNVTIVSDYQTYTNGIGRRFYKHKNQLNYISNLDVDFIVLAGPVLSKYFLKMWKKTIIELSKKNIGYILLSVGIMKLDDKSRKEIIEFFKEYPPYIFVSRDKKTYDIFGKYAKNAYNGICFSMFVNDYYSPCRINSNPYITLNFDKLKEPIIRLNNNSKTKISKNFVLDNDQYEIVESKLFNKIASKTDRYTDALIYMISILPSKRINNKIGNYDVIRTDHRFYPHFRSKIYNQSNSFCADIPYGYLNIYYNSKLTISDRVHACAVTMAFGNSAMLLSKTNRSELLDRLGAKKIYTEPTRLDMKYVENEKYKMLEWLKEKI